LIEDVSIVDFICVLFKNLPVFIDFRCSQVGRLKVAHFYEFCELNFLPITSNKSQPSRSGNRRQTLGNSVMQTVHYMVLRSKAEPLARQATKNLPISLLISLGRKGKDD